MRCRGRVQPAERHRIDLAGRSDARGAGRAVGPRLRQRLVRRPEEQDLVPIASEAGLHEQLDVARRVGARHVEADRPAPAAVADEMLDELVADIAGVGCTDPVELHDRPLVAEAVALHPQQAREPACLLVDVQQVVWPEGSQRQAEQAEHPDRGPADRQPKRSRIDALGLAQPRQLAERREVGQARRADLRRAPAAPVT